MPLLTAEDYQRFPQTPPDYSYAYGDHPQQFGRRSRPPSIAC